MQTQIISFKRALPFLLILGVLLLIFSCSPDDEIVPSDDGTEDQMDDTNDGSGMVDDDTPSTTDVRMFIFGHSIINHELLVHQTTPSQETSMPHWMHFLAESAGFDYAANGQYGFLGQHRDLPPISQWGFDHVQSIWDSDTQDFQDANFNTIILTAANFIQWQPANENYYQEDFSPVDATVEVFQWCTAQEDDLNIYIYEGWPDMDPFLAGTFEEITPDEFAEYHEYTLGEYHQWWLDYHDWVIEEMPDANIRMIPVGTILASLLTEVEAVATIPIVTDLYEDNSPHGRPTIYFLSGLISHMAIYGTQAPDNYVVPDIVHENVRNNYAEIVDFIWERLEAFDFEDGTSRVF